MDIQISNLTKSYEDKTVLDGFTITFAKGQINCLMGDSGIGKTTLLHLIMGLIKPDSGQILGCEGKKITAVFQEDRLIEHWDAVKNIKLACDKSVTEEQIQKELLEVGIEEVRGKPVGSFSGGMKRRVALIRAVMAGFDILILDEPFKGLDEALKQRVAKFLLMKTEGKTVIVVTHEKSEAGLLGAKLLTLDTNKNAHTK